MSPFFYFYTRYINIILAHDLLVTTILVNNILGSIIIKTLFPSYKLKFGTAFPKVIEDNQNTFKKKIQALLFVTLETLDSYADTSTVISEIKNASFYNSIKL